VARKKSSKTTLPQWNGAVVIPIDQLVPCDWNVNEMEGPEFAALIEEIRDGGFDEPCQIVPIAEGDHEGSYLILGGEHRYKAALSLQFTEVPCVIKEHLSDVDEETLMEWSVKRNNIRGKINAQRYAELQKRITGRWRISAEAARRRMLIREERMAKLKERLSPEVIDTMVRVESEAIGDGSSNSKMPSEEVNIDGPSPDRRQPPKDDRVLTPAQKSRKQAFADRRALLTSLKQFQQDVLQQSADTVSQGYLYFGVAGHTHLVVNETAALNKLVAEMVETCKANSDQINEFLISAIKKELPEWQ
jgi:ParB-like chromosome segregation protein Spo0J